MGGQYLVPESYEEAVDGNESSTASSYLFFWVLEHSISSYEANDLPDSRISYELQHLVEVLNTHRDAAQI